MALLLVALLLLPVQTPDVGTAVRRLAADAVKADPDFVGRPRVYAEGPSKGLLRYRVGPLPASAFLGPNDPLGAAVEVVARAQVLRRDLKREFPGSTFPLLATIEAAAVRAAREVRMPGSEIQADFEALGKEIARKARSTGRTPVKTQGDRSGFDVEISLAPANGKLRMMPYLVYRKCLFYRQPLEDRWRTYLPGKRTLIGLFRYEAVWPGGKVDRGNISFSNDAPYVFQAPGGV